MRAIPPRFYINLQWRLRPGEFWTSTGICDAAIHGITISFRILRTDATIDDQQVADRYGAELVGE